MFERYLTENPDKIWRFLVYRRMFTPYEQEQKFRDDHEFTSNHYEFAKIKDVFKICDDYVIIFNILDSEDRDSHVCEKIYRLSEIRLSSWDYDNREDEEYGN